MKNFLKIAIVNFIFFSLVFSVSGQSASGQVKTLNKIPVNPANIVMLKGQVKAVMTQIPIAGVQNSPIRHAIIKIKIFVKETGVEHIVQLAPGNFMTLQGLAVNRNDLVNVKAFKTQDTNELKSMTLEKAGRVFILRDQYGRGLWEKTDIRPGRDNRIR